MHQIFTGWLQYFPLKKKKVKVKCVLTSSHTLWISLAAKKRGNSIFSHSCFLSIRSRRQGLGQRARSFGRWWGHQLCIRVRMMLSFLSLRSCHTPVDELKQHLLGDGVWDAVTHSHGSVVGIRKTFVCSLSHKDPAVVLEFAFYNFVVILF